jgi:hypothetical protein
MVEAPRSRCDVSKLVTRRRAGSVWTTICEELEHASTANFSETNVNKLI